MKTRWRIYKLHDCSWAGPGTGPVKWWSSSVLNTFTTVWPCGGFKYLQLIHFKIHILFPNKILMLLFLNIVSLYISLSLCLSLGPSLCLSLVVHISSCVCLMYKDKQTFTFYHTDEQFSYVRHSNSTIYEYFWPNVPHLRTTQVRLLPTGSIINLCWEDIRRKPNPKSNTPSLTKCHSTTCWTSHNLEGNIFHTAIVSLTKQQLHIGSKPQNSHMK